MVAHIRGNGLVEKPMDMGQKLGQMVRYGMMANGNTICQYKTIHGIFVTIPMFIRIIASKDFILVLVDCIYDS
jgi:hypothetical protein